MRSITQARLIFITRIFGKLFNIQINHKKNPTIKSDFFCGLTVLFIEGKIDTAVIRSIHIATISPYGIAIVLTVWTKLTYALTKI